MEKTQGEYLEFNQCEEAVKRLNDFLSHELAADEEVLVNQHLQECNGCFEKFRFEVMLLQKLRSRAGQMQAPDALRQHILGLLHKN